MPDPYESRTPSRSRRTLIAVAAVVALVVVVILHLTGVVPH